MIKHELNEIWRDASNLCAVKKIKKNKASAGLVERNIKHKDVSV